MQGFAQHALAKPPGPRLQDFFHVLRGAREREKSSFGPGPLAPKGQEMK